MFSFFIEGVGQQGLGLVPKLGLHQPAVLSFAKTSETVSNGLRESSRARESVDRSGGTDLVTNGFRDRANVSRTLCELRRYWFYL